MESPTAMFLYALLHAMNEYYHDANNSINIVVADRKKRELNELTEEDAYLIEHYIDKISLSNYERNHIMALLGDMLVLGEMFGILEKAQNLAKYLEERTILLKDGLKKNKITKDLKRKDFDIVENGDLIFSSISVTRAYNGNLLKDKKIFDVDVEATQTYFSELVEIKPCVSVHSKIKGFSIIDIPNEQAALDEENEYPTVKPEPTLLLKYI